MESQIEDSRRISLKRRVGRIGLAIGLLLIGFVIILGLLASAVSAYDGSVELVQVYNTLAVPIFVFGIFFVLGGLLAILLPEGMTKDGTWSLQTGPLR